MYTELPIPDFLKEDEDDIHNRMLSKAPKDISTLPGDFFWDNTRPVAEEIARMKQLDLQQIFIIVDPRTSYGKYLEFLGECKGVSKNPATKATGAVIFRGVENTIIPKGTIVTTASDDDTESIEFELLETKIIGKTNTVEVIAECRIAGTIGNAQPNTITVLTSSINGVESLSNNLFTGGTDIEDEEHYRQRVIEAEQNDFLSGSDSDYERWAKEVDGVGFAHVIEEWNGPGTVKVLILDKERKAATQELINKVQQYIYPLNIPKGQNRGGKAPTGAIVTIDTPKTLIINVKANFIFSDGFLSTTVLSVLKQRIDKYLDKIDIGGTVLYSAIYTIIGSMMLQNEGIKEFTNLTINDKTENIVLQDQVVGIGEVVNV